MEKPALKKSNATKYTVYLPFNKNDHAEIPGVRKKILEFVRKIFKGATVYSAEGIYVPEKEEAGTVREQPQRRDQQQDDGEDLTYVLEVLVESLEHKETRVEQLAWLILCHLDNLHISKERSSREKEVWFYEQPVTLYKLFNPDLKKSPEIDVRGREADRSSSAVPRKGEGA